MNRKQLSDRVKLRMGILGADTRLDERTIWWLGDMVRTRILGEYVQKFGSSSRGHWMMTVTADVKTDATTGLKYCSIDFIDTPDGYELVQVGKVKDLENPFFQQEVGQAAVYNGLEAAAIGTTFWHETGKIFFNNLPFEVDKVAVRCSPSLESLTDDDDIPMPTTIEDAVLEGIAQKLMSQLPTDKTSDTRNSPE